jgi:L-ascorbate metabolism protein UlaG (beta-lactamase superfamily)
LLALSGCTVLSIEPSSHYRTPAKTLVLDDELALTSTGAAYMDFMHLVKGGFLPASFRIDAAGKTIHIDQLRLTNPQPADLILITHAHADHLSPDDIARLATAQTLILGPRNITRKLADYSTRTLQPGDRVTVDGITITAVPAYNLKRHWWQPVIHKPNGDYLGYLIDIGDWRLYHAGDTDFTPDMASLTDVDVALLPIGVGATAMSPEDAAQAANALQPAWLVPMHYDLGTGQVERLQIQLQPGIRVFRSVDE